MHPTPLKINRLVFVVETEFFSEVEHAFVNIMYMDFMFQRSDMLLVTTEIEVLPQDRHGFRCWEVPSMCTGYASKRATCTVLRPSWHSVMAQ
jgi:hypothetical protein